MAEDEVEQTLLIIRECFVYKIPPRTTAAGYKAADWHVSQPIWTGRLVIAGKGDTCAIKLESPNGDLFATCPIKGPTGQVVEGVTDSSRYFVIRIEDGSGHHAFIGLGFTERSDAFDFNVALQDFEKHLKQRRDSAVASQKLAPVPKMDLSLKEGQTIHVKLTTTKGILGATATPGARADPPSASGGIAPLLPPPPGAKGRGGHSRQPSGGAQMHQHIQQHSFGAPPPQAQAQDVAWGDFQAFPAAAPPVQQQPMVIQQQPPQQQPQYAQGQFSALAQQAFFAAAPQQQQQQHPAPVFMQAQPVPAGGTILIQPTQFGAPPPQQLSPQPVHVYAQPQPAAAPQSPATSPITPTYTLAQPPFMGGGFSVAQPKAPQTPTQAAPQQQQQQQQPPKVQPFSFS